MIASAGTTGLEHAAPFSEADRSVRWRRQWAVLQPGDAAPEGWKRRELASGRVLHMHPDLRASEASGAAGRLLLLGLAVDPSNPALDLCVALAGCAEQSSPEAALKHLLHRLAGTYALLHDAPDDVHLYTDPAAMMGIFHGGGRAASTPGLLPGLEPDHTLARVFPFGGANDWYPGSLCPFVGVSALIANHRLSLGSGRCERFWPDRAPATREHAEGLEEISQLMRGIVMGLVQRGPVLCSLTGGRDSRVSLAAAREAVDQIEFFTLSGPTVKPCDLEYSGELARRFDLDRHLIEVPPVEPWLTGLYDEMTAGMAVGARREILGACRLLASPRYIHLNGNLGAITKSFFWPSPHPRSVETRVLAKEFTDKPAPILDAIEEWRSTLPDLPPSMVYNLMYLEQRGGRWMGIGETGSNLFYESASVFCSRQVFEAVTALPERSQHGGTLLVDLVGHMWPELLEVPYCRVTRNWGTYLPKGLKQAIKRVLGRE